MSAIATKQDDTLSLDFSGFNTESVRVNGAPVQFEQKNSKLLLTLTAALARNQSFTVETVYEGHPAQVASSALDGENAGWITYPGGAVTVCEPDLAHTWFPCNDHPLNKASFDFDVAVPAGYTVIANGVEHGESRWQITEPIQTCMALVAIGKYEESQQTGPHNLPIRNFFPPGSRSTYAKSLARDPDFLTLLESRLGPYPYHTYGTIELPQEVASVNRIMSGSALESVSIPVFSSGSATSESTLIHEMCHQWMGDCVSISNWGDDIWWVEGFATYAEYMRLELTGGKAACDHALQNLYSQLAKKQTWLKPGHLTAEQMFGEAAYEGGCMVFHALRLKLGDELFFKTIRKFIDDHRYGNGSTEALIQTATDTSGQDMHPFFKAWLYGDTIPALDKAALSSSARPPFGASRSGSSR